ncbi:MAG: hypothetical protein WDM96_08545 [Lacunisphaera sp.]
MPAGDKGAEWSGPGNTWVTGTNWFGGASPDGVGKIGIFRDVDSGLPNKTITSAATARSGSSTFEATGGPTFTLSNSAGSSLTFDNGGAGAKIFFDGLATPVISSAVVPRGCQRPEH